MRKSPITGRGATPPVARICGVSMDKPCKIWTGYKSESGYGKRWVKVDPFGRWTKPRLVRVHRDEWEKVHGPIPDGMKLLHKCDVRACYEIEHLYLGTQKDNVSDMDERGRRVRVGHRGSAHPKARLTPDQVAEILVSSGTQREIAERYGIKAPAVWKIKHGVAWKNGSGVVVNDVFYPLAGGDLSQHTVLPNAAPSPRRET